MKLEEFQKDKQKTVFAAGMVMLEVAACLLLARLVLPYIMDLFPALDEFTEDLVSTVIFDFMVQILALLVIPFLIYKFYLKKSTKEVLYMSNVRRTDARIYILSFLLGIVAVILTMYVSTVWQTMLAMFGYDISSSSPMPDKFQLWHLLLMIFLTAVLPAICEEFTNRGIFLSAMRSCFSETATILIGGIAFGLFHQYITQTFYTALMGMLLTYLVLKTRSIIPAAIVHFTNNFISVIMNFATTYLQSDPCTFIINLVTSSALFNFLVLAVSVALLVVLLYYINRIYGKYYTGNYAEYLKTGDAKYLNNVACYWNTGDVKYVMSNREKVCYFGAIAVTAVYTVFTFIWGLY